MTKIINKHIFLLLFSISSFASNECVDEFSYSIGNTKDLMQEILGATASYQIASKTLEKNCNACKKENPKPRAVANCMGKMASSLKEKYHDSIKDQLIKMGIFYGQDRIDDSPEKLDKIAQYLYKQCPQLSWDNMMKQDESGLEAWLGGLANCIDNKLCISQNLKDKNKCREISYQQSQYILPEVVALFQTKIFQGDILDIGPRQNKEKHRHEIETEKIIQQSNMGQKRKAKLAQISEEATKRQMGCPRNVQYNLENEKYICIKPSEDKSQVFVKHIDQMEGLVNDYLYRDLTSFAAKKVWESYTLSLLMDPKMLEIPCQKGEEASLEMIKELIGFDSYMGSQSNPFEGRVKLNLCFEKTLNLGARVIDLAKAAYNIKCKIKSSELEGPCAKDANDKGKSKDRHIQLFTKRAKKLNQVDKKIKQLLKGKLRHNGRVVSCGKKQCSEFFEWEKNCAPMYLITQGCRAPDLFTTEEKLAYSLMNNLKDTKEMIINKNPELVSKIAYGKNGEVVEAYKTIDPTKTYTKRKIEYRFNDALRVSRQKKLDLIVNHMCNDPRSFAKNLLISNPKLVNEFLKSSANPDVGKLLCVGLSQAEIETGREQRLKSVSQLGVMLLGTAMVLPTGGASLLYTSAAATTLGSLGLAAYDLNNALTRLKSENGMFHGCVGEYNKIALAQEELDDATFWASIELGLAPTAFLGLSSLAKAKELQKIAKSSKSIQQSKPGFIKKLESVIGRLKGTPSKQSALIANEYELKDLPGLINKRGKLTKDGKNTVTQIQKLERFGFSKSKINELLRTCN